jgi:hypothetical protein
MDSGNKTKKMSRLFHNPNDFLPKWADPKKLSSLQAMKIIDYRMTKIVMI